MPFSGTPTNQAATIFSTKDKLIESKTIVAENIISGKDKRTTVMIRNIPLKYTIQNLVDELNSLFAGKFDFVNMPINLEVRIIFLLFRINLILAMHLSILLILFILFFSLRPSKTEFGLNINLRKKHQSITLKNKGKETQLLKMTLCILQ